MNLNLEDQLQPNINSDIQSQRQPDGENRKEAEEDEEDDDDESGEEESEDEEDAPDQ